MHRRACFPVWVVDIQGRWHRALGGNTVGRLAICVTVIHQVNIQHALKPVSCHSAKYGVPSGARINENVRRRSDDKIGIMVTRGFKCHVKFTWASIGFCIVVVVTSILISLRDLSNGLVQDCSTGDTAGLHWAIDIFSIRIRHWKSCMIAPVPLKNK